MMEKVYTEDMAEFGTRTIEPIGLNDNLDIDSAIERLEYLKDLEAKARTERIDLEVRLAMIAEALPGDAKTRRVAGSSRSVKVIFKTYENWDNRALEIIKDRIGDPVFSRYFRVGNYKPNVRELQKLRYTAGQSEILYHDFMKAMTSSQGKPTVTIEETKGGV